MEGSPPERDVLLATKLQVPRSRHVSHLMGKLGAANRTEAVARGRELGLID